MHTSITVHFYSCDASLSGRNVPVFPPGVKLEPFRTRDTDRGIYTDENDPLGRVWYHIPNLGPKFCDAVRKYSIVANYREAHVIARKKSKDSECMWVGIVGDPAGYTTGSKRHIIDMLLRNPEQNFDQANGRVQSRVRIRTISGLKRRKRRKRPTTAGESDVSRRSIKQSEDNTSCGVNSDNLSDSSHISSGSLSVLSKENIDMEAPAYGFAFREQSPSINPTLSRYGLPPLTVETVEECQQDWLDSLCKDPALYALKEPPLPSPGNFFISSKFETYLSQTIQRRQSVPVFPRYSVADLNELLVESLDLSAI